MPNYIKIKNIKCIGKQDVYNMEVKNHHNYSVNGGLIIHNCDSLRYIIQTLYPVKGNKVRTMKRSLLGL